MAPHSFNVSDRTIGERIARTRASIGLTREDLRSRLGERGVEIHLTAIGKIERGERGTSATELAAIADAMGTSSNALLGIDDASLAVPFAKLEIARSALQEAAWNYLEELLDTALAADSANSVRDADALWLTSAMPWQTPAMMLRVGTSQVMRGSLGRRGIEAPGRYVQLLIEAIERDGNALEEPLDDELPIEKDSRAKHERTEGVA